MDIHKIKLLFNTILYLKPIQVYYRVYYLLRNKFFGKEVKKRKLPNFNSITWKQLVVNKNSYLDKNNSFSFLNIPYSFTDKIDWNHDKFGKLWTYNLNYFDYLNQEGISNDTGIHLINDYTKNDKILKDGKESYPTSLRGINWVKFLSKNKR